MSVVVNLSPEVVDVSEPCVHVCEPHAQRYRIRATDALLSLTHINAVRVHDFRIVDDWIEIESQELTLVFRDDYMQTMETYFRLSCGRVVNQLGWFDWMFSSYVQHWLVRLPLILTQTV
jgi:hypothetical protein